MSLKVECERCDDIQYSIASLSMQLEGGLFGLCLCIVEVFFDCGPLITMLRFFI